MTVGRRGHCLEVTTTKSCSTITCCVVNTIHAPLKRLHSTSSFHLIFIFLRDMMSLIAKIRYVFAVVVITGSAPNYFLLWFLWRGISLFLPQWKYQDGDDFLYSMYQRMVIFFFEHCTGQKVIYFILFYSNSS